MGDTSNEFLKPPEIAKLLRVSQEKVLGWIRRADLRAVNVGNGSRPQYRISRESFDDFLKDREVDPPPERIRREKRQDQTPEGGPINPVLGEALLKKGQAVKYGNTYYRVWNGITLYF